MYYHEVSEAVIKREKAAARDLRHSRWWQNQLNDAACHYCKKKLLRSDVTMDHLIPISSGGKSIKSNVVPSCKECNNRKRDRHIIDVLP